MTIGKGGFQKNSGDEGRTKRLYITLTAFVLVALFAGWLIRAIFSSHAGWRDVEFETALNRFDYNIMLARVEWMRQGEPTDVFLSLAEWDKDGKPGLEAEGKVRVLMSRTGWPLARSEGMAGCLELWHLLGHVGDLRRELKVTYEITAESQLCRFFYGGKEAFHFSPSSGKVEILF